MKSLWNRCENTVLWKVHRETSRLLLREGIIWTLPGTNDFLPKRNRLTCLLHCGWGTSLLTAGVTAVGIDSFSAFIQILADLLWNDFQVYEKGLYVLGVLRYLYEYVSVVMQQILSLEQLFINKLINESQVIEER